MTMREARRAAILAQVRMVGPIVLDTFGIKRLRFSTGATPGQIETAIEELTRTGELRLQVMRGQIVVAAVGGGE